MLPLIKHLIFPVLNKLAPFVYKNALQVFTPRESTNCPPVPCNAIPPRHQCWWRKIYGRNAKLTKRTIYRCYNNLVETGSLEVKKRGPKPTTKVKDAQNITVVKNIMDQDPDKSVRQVGRESALSYSTVYRILTDELDYHPWKPHYVQELHDNDPERRLRFACEMESLLSPTPTRYLQSP